MDNLERQLINEQLAKCIELSEKYNELVNKYLPQDLSIYLSKDKWLWTYRCLDSESDFELSFDSPIHALCHFIGLILEQQEKNQSFSKQTQNFQDALNEALEDEPYDDEIMSQLTQVSDILNDVIQDL